MPGMEGLGRLFNLVHTAKGVYVNMKDASSVTFVCQLATGDTFTVQEATTLAGGGAQNLPTVTQYYTASAAGTGAWARVTQATAATVVTASAVVAVFTIRAEELSDGYSYVKCTSTGAGTVTAVAHDLLVRRAPANLPALSA